MTQNKFKVLFVCMGNICRSPTGEAVLKARVRAAGLQDRFHIDSCGTIGYHAGQPADPRMRRAAAPRGYQLESIARQFHVSDFDTFDLILAMDRDNLEDLQRLDPAGNHADKVRLFCDYVDDPTVLDVPDPYYGGDQGFEHVIDLVEQGCDKIIARHRPGRD